MRQIKLTHVGFRAHVNIASSRIVSLRSTGCAYLSASSTSCACWFTSAFRGPHRATCRTPSARSRVRNHGVIDSSADLIVPATRSTAMGAGPRLRRRSTARLEQSTGRDPPQPISGRLQTFTENSLLYPVFLLTLFLLPLVGAL